MLKLSVIIPVYNVEKYLKKCIESVLIQKIDKSEIILVDDGSTDKSGIICDEYSKKYDNVNVIHKKNGGLSSARNAGIKEAKGEYLMFVDSDDFINENEKINDLLPYLKYDVIQYKMIYFYNKKQKYMYLKDMNTYEVESYMEKLEKKVYDGSLSISACDKIIKKNLVKENNIYFEEGLLSEDIDWSLRLYLKANSLIVTNKNIYVYRQQREGSISTKVQEKNIISLYNIVKKWYNYEYKNNNQKSIFLNYLAYQYSILLCNMNRKNCSKKMKKDIYEMKDLLNYNNNYKVEMVRKISRLFGIEIGRRILKIYLFLKNNGILKL